MLTCYKTSRPFKLYFHIQIRTNTKINPSLMRLSNSPIHVLSGVDDIRDIVKIVHNMAKKIGMAVMANEVDKMLHVFEVNGGYSAGAVPIRENNFACFSCPRPERIGNANSGTWCDYQHRTNIPLAI